MMRSTTLVTLVLSMGLLVAFSANMACGAWYDDAEWYDEYYQYRIPVEASPTATGLQVLNVSTSTILEKINALEAVDYSDTYFDYDRVEIVEYNENGEITDVIDSAGFFVCYNGS